jgi:hypothetical protein
VTCPLAVASELWPDDETSDDAYGRITEITEFTEKHSHFGSVCSVSSVV